MGVSHVFFFFLGISYLPFCLYVMSFLPFCLYVSGFERRGSEPQVAHSLKTSDEREAGFWVFEEVVPYFQIHRSFPLHRDCRPAPNRAYITGHRSMEWNAWERVNPYVPAAMVPSVGIMNMPCSTVGEERIAFAWTGFEGMNIGSDTRLSDDLHLKKAWCPFKFVCVNTTRALAIPGCYKHANYGTENLRTWQKDNHPPSFCHVP